MLAEPTERFLSELPEARDLHEAALMLRRYSRALPATRAAFDYDLANPGLAGSSGSEPVGVELGWPSDLVRRWVKNSLVLACPLVVPCRKMRRPFTWDIEEDNLGIAGDVVPRPFTAMGQQTLHTMREAGVRSGITVPVHQPGGRTGFVSWVCENGLGEVRQWAEANAGDLFLVAHAFLDRVETMIAPGGSGGEACPLTERERECLSWVARGKTDGEIGIIIARSSETARFHVRNAIAKLDAASRSHAVAKAIRRGWIGSID